MSPPPLPPVEPEEEVNLPPEQPLPPHGSSTIKKGINATYQVSSWDKNDHQLRFQIDWGDDNRSLWSDFVASNESIQFTYQYTHSGYYSIKVIAQDKQGLNSTWSQPLSIQVINPQINTNEKEDQSEIEIKVNNETGETSFKYNTTTSNHSTASIVWDFGDGTIVQGNSPKHSYEKPGEYNVKITITDEHGNVTMKTYTVTITEPQQQIDETSLDESESNLSSLPWIMIMVGIFSSVIGVFIILLLQRKTFS
jgi:PKD repeat protein